MENRTFPLYPAAAGLAGLALAGLMYLVMLNSGLGYDSLLYLILGEDWRRGILPYTSYVEIKPIGIFLLDRLILSVSRSPYWIDLAVLAIDLTLVGVTVACFARWLNRTEQVILGFSIFCLGFLTEMSFLLTDQPMTIFAVVGFGLLLKPGNGRGKLAGGIALGISFLFKAPGAFYLVAAIMAFAVRPGWQRIYLRKTLPGYLRDCIPTIAGFAIPFGLLAIWAGSHGLLQRMLFLSIWVPLFHYPSHTVFLWSFAGKLGPFLLIWLVSAGYWLARPLERRGDRGLWQTWLLIFSVVSGGQFLKNQGSHYLIAALPFMTAFIISVWSPVAQTAPRRTLRVAMACGAAALLVFVLAFRGKILARVGIPDLKAERRLAAGIVELTRPGEQALFINGVVKSSCYLYWITGLRPPRPWPYLAIDVYSYGLADAHRGKLVESLRNSNTALVGMVPEESPSYLGWPWPWPEDELREARRILDEKFEPVEAVNGFATHGLWKRKGRTPDGAASFTAGPYSN